MELAEYKAVAMKQFLKGTMRKTNTEKITIRKK